MGHPHAGGAEIVTHEHAKAWVKAGHEVMLFTSSYLRAKSQEVIDGVKIIRQGNEILGVHLRAFWWYLFGKHPNFDLVVDQFHGIPFFTPLYVRTKKLAFIHEVAKEVWLLNPWPKPLNLIFGTVGRMSEPWIFRILYQNIPFMTVSESTKKDLISWGVAEKNVTVIHNGVNVVIPNPMPKKEHKKTAIFLGALSRDKGIEDAVAAFKEIDRLDENWQFWIVGKGETTYTKSLFSLVQKVGLEKKVKFWGYVSERKKFELLSKAHVLVNPSVREGWGLVNIEANSVGTPVVGYDVPGCRDSVRSGQSGFLSPLGTYKGLVSNMLKLLSDKELYKRLQKQAILWSKNFSWEKTLKQSLDLIKGLVKK